MSIRRPCVEPGCPFLALDGRREGRCARCLQVSTDTRNRAKPAEYRDPGYRALRAIYRTNNMACWICGRPNADTLDHVVPLADGGTNALDNLRPAHRACNSGRGTREVTRVSDRERVTRVGDSREMMRRTGQKFKT